MDYVIIGFVFLGTITGYRKGMMVSLVSFLSWIIAGAGAFLLTPRVVIYLDGYIDLTGKVAGIIRHKMPVGSLAAGDSNLPFGLFDMSGLNKYIQDIWVLTPAGSGGLADVLSHQAATILAHGLVFTALFIFFLFGLRFFAGFFSRRIQGTLLGFFNRLGGMFVGTAVNIMAAVFVIGMIAPWLAISAGSSAGFLRTLSDSFAESVIAPYFIGIFGWITAMVSGAPV